MINIATVFSGIGSIEWAFKRLKLNHKIIFDCDNGGIEIYIEYIEKVRNKVKSLKTIKEQNEYIKKFILILRELTSSKNHT